MALPRPPDRAAAEGELIVDDMFDPHEMANQLAQAIAGIKQVLAPIDEATSGYRTQLEAAGWSSHAAEKMALEFHRMLMAQVNGGGQ